MCRVYRAVDVMGDPPQAMLTRLFFFSSSLTFEGTSPPEAPPLDTMEYLERKPRVSKHAHVPERNGIRNGSRDLCAPPYLCMEKDEMPYQVTEMGQAACEQRVAEPSGDPLIDTDLHRRDQGY